jgi:hypothetical protein
MTRAQILLSIVICNCVTTWMHYTDNAIYVKQYPEPDWFTTSAVFITVALMTPIGLFGYWLYRQHKYLLAYIVLGIYAITGLSSPGHYLFPGAMDMTMKMHSLIWLDAIAGLSLIGFILWSAAILHEWSIISERATSGGSESQS